MRPGRGVAGRRTAGAFAVVLVLLGVAGCGGRPTTHHRPGTGHEQATGAAGRLLDTKDESGHRLRDVPAEGAPAVRLIARPDPEDGWNLQLAVERFRFTPESVGGAALLGRGHAHLLLDGREIARLYGPWHHLPASAVPPGARVLTVRLHADDHTAWAVAGRPVEATARLTSRPGSAGHPHASTRAPEPAHVHPRWHRTVHRLILAA